MDGEGARIYGGRWNLPGTAVVYFADSRALAALEILVHAGRESVRWDWRVFCVTIADELIDQPKATELPKGWDGQPSSTVAQNFGTDWAKRGMHPAILLPSAVIPSELALVLNVKHPAISEITISEPETFLFDRRLG